MSEGRHQHDGNDPDQVHGGVFLSVSGLLFGLRRVADPMTGSSPTGSGSTIWRVVCVAGGAIDRDAIREA
jgi:hypothetical protein